MATPDVLREGTPIFTSKPNGRPPQQIVTTLVFPIDSTQTPYRLFIS
jgi:hypothetical protein